MGRRQAAVEQTRERIVAATFDLHATIGPSRTTIRAIADRAGVQRHTVYAHFPDLDSLYAACTVHGIRSTGMPEAEGWSSIKRPIDRLRQGLTEMIAWYRANEPMLSLVLFDIDPEAPPPTAPDPFELRTDAWLVALLDGWSVAPARRSTLEAVVRHALDFTTWRSLIGCGLTDAQVVDVLVGLAERVADGSIVTGPSRSRTRRTCHST
jgi:AcrR family transcriptional regulator